MTSGKVVSPALPDHLFALLEGARRRAAEVVSDEMGRSSRLTGLRGSHGRMLQMIQPGGSRISDLAHLSRTTKQATGQLVDTLERMGLVTSGPDPDDRRVRRVELTAHGRLMVTEINRVIARAEVRLRAEIGARRYDTMRRVLSELGVDQF